MLINARLGAIPIFLFGMLAVGVFGCSNNSPTTNARSGDSPAANSSKTNSAVSQSSSPKLNSPQPASPQPNVSYQQALVKAESATSISQSAISPEDWAIVSRKWQQAIQLLKAVPASHPNYKNAKAKLAEYQQQFDYAQKKANPNPALASAGPKCFGKPDRSYANASSVFTAPIKRREHSTVVIDVTFFNSGLRQTYEMILDSGASATLITGEMATGLRIKPIGATKANTASGQGVIFGIGCMDSMQVGGAVVRNLPVIIGTSLDIGLLGQDFFGGYDVTIKQNVVEFRHR